MYAVFCMFLTTFGHKKMDVSASGPDGFQTFRVEGCRRGGELTAIEGCILLGRDEKGKKVGNHRETI